MAGPRSETIELVLDIHAAPSPQHKAGLGGLAVLLQTLARKSSALTFRVSESQLSLTLTESSLSALLTYLYQTVNISRKTSRPPRSAPYETIVVEEGYGQTSLRHSYTEQRPAGDWLVTLGCPESRVAAWRDGIWHHLRSVVAARQIYSVGPAIAIKDLWQRLVQAQHTPQAVADVSGALLIGARSANAEDIPFRDTPANVLLLHFAPTLACPIPLCQADTRGDLTFSGLAWVAPVPRSLPDFHEAARRYLTKTLPECVALPEEAALAFLAACPNPGALDGVFHAHLDKQGHNNLVRSTGYLSAGSPLLRQYRTLVAPLTSLPIRRLVLGNLLQEWPAERGLSALALPHENSDWDFVTRDCRRLAAALQPPAHETLRDRLIAVLQQQTQKRCPSLSYHNYTRGQGYLDMRKKFRGAWTSNARLLASRLRAARTRNLFQKLADSLQIGQLQTPWESTRDALALALASCTLTTPEGS